MAYSCKGRGVCPSCNTRRMVEMAAHLTDDILEEAQQVIDKMVEVVKDWRELFARHKVEERSVEYISGTILPECFFRKEAALGSMTSIN